MCFAKAERFVGCCFWGSRMVSEDCGRFGGGFRRLVRLGSRWEMRGLRWIVVVASLASILEVAWGVHKRSCCVPWCYKPLGGMRRQAVLAKYLDEKIGVS